MTEVCANRVVQRACPYIKFVNKLIQNIIVYMYIIPAILAF